MHVFCDEDDFHTVAGILNQTHLRRTSMAYVCSVSSAMRRFYHIVMVVTSVVVASAMP